MKNEIVSSVWFVLLSVIVLGSCSKTIDSRPASAIPFGEGGQLKMLYDNRMHPQAVEYGGNVYMVWRGEKGLPYIRAFDLKTREFSEASMMLAGLELRIDKETSSDFDRYERDQHNGPVVWVDSQGYFHVISGCHGNSPRNYSGGVHIRSGNPGDIHSPWKLMTDEIDISVNYPKPYRIYDDKSLVYYRRGGHLSEWTYSISDDDGKTWVSPSSAVVDLNFQADPEISCLDFHSGSYQSVRVGKDGKSLHVAFIWALQDWTDSDCKPYQNSRYTEKLSDDEYNLYYIKVDLPSGKAFNYEEEELQTPVTRAMADQKCLIYDTEDRILSVPPYIYLDENDQPSFLATVSESTPYRCLYKWVHYDNGTWKKTNIAETSHYFNSSLVYSSKEGTLKAILIIGDGEANRDEAAKKDKQNMNRYGWGERVEEWTSEDSGNSWELRINYTPMEGYRYQNIKAISAAKGNGEIIPEMFIFYGWESSGKPGSGMAFLLDMRR